MEGHSIEATGNGDMLDHIPFEYTWEQVKEKITREEFEEHRMLGVAIHAGEITQEDPRYQKWQELEQKVHDTVH